MIEPDANQLIASFFRRWSELEDRKDEVASDAKELATEIKATGLDAKVARAVFRDKRREDNATAEERAKTEDAETVYQLYWTALEAGASKPYARPASAREEKIEKIRPETADLVAPETGAAEAGVSGQPETIPANADGRNVEATVKQRPSATPFPLSTSSETSSAGDPSPTSGETDLVEAGTGQNSAVLPQEPCTADFQPPAFLAREDKPFRPNCLNPGDNCGGQGNQHCYSCRKAMAEADAVPA